MAEAERMSRRTAVLAALVGASVGCLPATNPCDPGAPLDLQAEGTRLSAVVVDQRGAPLSGVLVGISGRAETQVSSADGAVTFSDLPPSAGYELVALPSAPLVGGRLSTPALGCRAELDAGTLVVVVPPASPEVEIVRATSERKVFAAFGAAADDAADDAEVFVDGDSSKSELAVADECNSAAAVAPVRYRMQVRAPFGPWREAVLAPFPWANPLTAEGTATEGADVAVDAALQYAASAVDGRCARALCREFEYLEPDLQNPAARCVEIAGFLGDDGAVTSLQPFGSYQVRALAELRTDDALRATFQLPERVAAAPATTTGQITLVPSALLPVVDATGAPRQVGDVSALVPVAGGRFALVESDTLQVIGAGSDVLDSAAQGEVSAGAPQNAFGEDEAAVDAIGGDFNDGLPPAEVQPLALLPAGAWLRVVRRTDDGSSSIKKVYVGASNEAVRSGPLPDDAAQNAAEPELTLDPASSAPGSELRAFQYLVHEDASLVEEGVLPRDGYVLLYRSAFVLVEQGAPADMALSYFAAEAPSFADADGDPNTDDAALVVNDWANSADAQDGVTDGAAFSGACAGFDGALVREDLDRTAEDLSARVSVCYDVAAGLGDDDVDLRDVEGLPGVVDRHIIADAAGDRVLVTVAADLTCAGCTVGAEVTLSDRLDTVPVGREPLALLRSRALRCDAAPGADNVVLVANHGSGDVSVVGAEAGVVRERFIVPLPILPIAFLDDPAGPSCEDPFVWVLGDDGRAVPIDMRGEPSVPLCNDLPCEVGTRGRGAVGAVARGAGEAARGLVGGAGLLGELGFFRPQALRGDAFRDDQVSEPPPAP
jgi:hypothetical protein